MSEVRICCKQLEEQLEMGSNGVSYYDFKFRLGIDNYLFGIEIHFCPFCGERLRLTEGYHAIS